MFRHHPLLTVMTGLYLAAVGWLTLGPQPRALERASGLWQLLAWLHRHPSLEWIRFSTLEFSANVLMFVPIGVFLLLLLGRRRWWLAVLLGVLLSCGIEFTQLFLPGRVSDVRDLESNSIGAFAGVVIALVLTWPAAVRRRAQARADAQARMDAQARADAHPVARAGAAVPTRSASTSTW